MSQVELLSHSESDKSLFSENGRFEYRNGYPGKAKSSGRRASRSTDLRRRQISFDSAPDGGWGWVVTFSAFTIGVILDGISYSFGLFFKELYIYFNESRSLTSWIISTLNGTYLSIGPLASVLVSLFGCRKVAIFGAILSGCSFFACTWAPNVIVMILVYGLLGGCGLGLMYQPSLVIVGHYFKKRRALATGIAVCGSGVGAFVFGIIGEVLIEVYGWKGAMWIISAICLNGVVVSALFRPIETMDSKYKKSVDLLIQHQDLMNGTLEDSCNEQVKTKKLIDWNSIFYFPVLKSPTLVLYGLSRFLCMLGFFVPVVFIPDLAEAAGMTSQEAGVLIAIFGIVNTIGRVLCGWIADRACCDEIFLNSVFVLLGGVLTCFVPTYTTFVLMASYCAVFGLVTAVFTTLRSVIMANLLGLEKLNSSFGIIVLCEGIASFIGAPLAAHLVMVLIACALAMAMANASLCIWPVLPEPPTNYKGGALTDNTTSYNAAFYLAGTVIGLSGVICFPLRKVSNWENRNGKQYIYNVESPDAQSTGVS